MKTKTLLNDTTICHKLTESQLEGHHPLYDIATKNGHASLRSLLNDQNLWSLTVGQVARRLLPDATIAASALGSVRSTNKVEASRQNGKKGGRPRITDLRKIADRLDFSVRPQGGQWILSAAEEEPLHYSVKTEKDALLFVLNRAYERGMLTASEAEIVFSF